MEKLLSKIKGYYYENKFIFFIIGLLFIYFVVLMHQRTLFYDELYSFEHFIAKGPRHSLINYPYPNNHVFFSFLSSLVYKLSGDPYIGLRGISVIATVSNIFLLYYIINKFLSKHIAYVGIALFVSNEIVNHQLVQGRGYSLIITISLIAFLILHKICTKKATKLTYFFYAIICALGMFTIPIFLYIMVALSLTGGLFLLMNKEYKTLLYLIISSFIAVIFTLLCYTPIFINEGCNYLIGITPKYEGVSKIDIFFEQPTEVYLNGINKLTGNEWVSSGGENGIKSLMSLFFSLYITYQEFYPILNIFSFVLIIIIMLFSFIFCIKCRSSNLMFMNLFVFCFLLSMPIVLQIQGSFPYSRIFVVMSVPLTFGIVTIINCLIKLNTKLFNIFIVPIIMFAIVQFFIFDYNNYHMYRVDTSVQHALSIIDIKQYKNVLIGGEYQSLFIFFDQIDKGYSINSVGKDMDLAIIQNFQNNEYEMVWPSYYTYEQLPHKELEKMRIIFKDDQITILER